MRQRRRTFGKKAKPSAIQTVGTESDGRHPGECWDPTIGEKVFLRPDNVGQAWVPAFAGMTFQIYWVPW